MGSFETLWMVRGVFYIVAGVCCLGAWAWTGDAAYVLGTLFGLGFGIWDVSQSVRTSNEDEERMRTAPARVESATAGLEGAWERRGDQD